MCIAASMVPALWQRRALYDGWNPGAGSVSVASVIECALQCAKVEGNTVFIYTGSERACDCVTSNSSLFVNLVIGTSSFVFFAKTGIVIFTWFSNYMVGYNIHQLNSHRTDLIFPFCKIFRSCFSIFWRPRQRITSEWLIPSYWQRTYDLFVNVNRFFLILCACDGMRYYKTFD